MCTRVPPFNRKTMTNIKQRLSTPWTSNSLFIWQITHNAFIWVPLTSSFGPCPYILGLLIIVVENMKKHDCAYALEDQLVARRLLIILFFFNVFKSKEMSLAQFRLITRN